MSKSKVVSNKIINSKSSKSITSKKMGKTNSREKINAIERRIIILKNLRTFFKRNVLKVATLLIILSVIIVYTNSNKREVVDASSDISTLSAGKYSSEIVSLYNRDGEQDAFLKEMNRVQSLVGTYVISNSTLKEDSFSNLIKTLNKEINENSWTELKSEKSKYYNGKYTIDENGNLKFKFASKQIEPLWINNKDVSKYIILN